MIRALEPTNNMGIIDKRVAAIATGAKINTEKGLVNPPHRYNSKDNCSKSYIRSDNVDLSERRFNCGKYTIETTLTISDKTIKIIQ